MQMEYRGRMHAAAALVTAVAAIACGSFRQAQAGSPQPKGDRWAVLVGVDEYAVAGKLQYCGADQRALCKTLVASGFPKNQVFLLDDTARESCYRPSKGNIERQVDGVLRTAAEGDVVVLGFSGHGTEIDGRMYFVPGDGDPDAPDTLVSLDKIYDRLRECQASVKIVIVDACRNDPRPGARSGGAPAGARALAASLEKKRLPEGVVLLTSCASGEISWEEETFGHGVFMHYVLEGLEGKAEADGDGAVSLNELAKYAARQTKSFVLNKQRVTQRPYLRNEGDADLLDFALLPVAGRQAGAVVENSIGMKLVRIEAGQFAMGSKETAGQFANAGFVLPHKLYDPSNEKPVHLVRISRPFFMGQTEVTLGQFLQFYHDGFEGKLDCETGVGMPQGGYGYHADNAKYPYGWDPQFRPWNWGHPNQTNNHPVVNVSWNDAVAFCEWLSRKEKARGRKYRLPTEAEWEYACRGGTTTRFWYGDDPEEVATIENFSASRTHVFSAAVGAFHRPNPNGLHDMHGNVSEWCSDWYDKDYYGKSPEADPKGPDAGSFRVIRGGTAYSFPVDCRSARRNESGTQWRRYDRIGFRVVCELE